MSEHEYKPHEAIEARDALAGKWEGGGKYIGMTEAGEIAYEWPGFNFPATSLPEHVRPACKVIGVVGIFEDESGGWYRSPNEIEAVRRMSGVHLITIYADGSTETEKVVE